MFIILTLTSAGIPRQLQATQTCFHQSMLKTRAISFCNGAHTQLGRWQGTEAPVLQQRSLMKTQILDGWHDQASAPQAGGRPTEDKAVY